MKWRDRIVSDPEILVGKPVIKNTRISVELILGSGKRMDTRADSKILSEHHARGYPGCFSFRHRAAA